MVLGGQRQLTSARIGLAAPVSINASCTAQQASLDLAKNGRLRRPSQKAPSCLLPQANMTFGWEPVDVWLSEAGYVRNVVAMVSHQSTGLQG